MNDWREDLAKLFEGTDAVIKFDEPLEHWTSLRIGGPADILIVVKDEKQLSVVRRWTGDHIIKIWALGQGTNVVVSDQGLRGVVVKLAGSLAQLEVFGKDKEGGVLIRAGAGTLLDYVAEFAERNNLSGADFLAGIPGTIGGGLFSNAGAFGHCLGEIVVQAMVIDSSGVIRVLGRDELKNDYRRPVIDDSLIVTEAVLRLLPGPGGQSVRSIRERRWRKHPEEPSAGSFFKNPARDMPAGVLIERCGLKGVRVGGATVSEKHANFIVNSGGARFADVYELCQLVKAVVEEKTGFELEEEVQLLPDFKEKEGQAAIENCGGIEKGLKSRGERR
ncbi:MAG: UDP-N-acetylmuramate dehydrogenase [bacterium]